MIDWWLFSLSFSLVLSVVVGFEYPICNSLYFVHVYWTQQYYNIIIDVVKLVSLAKGYWVSISFLSIILH